jgi:GLPGLI family protein
MNKIFAKLFLLICITSLTHAFAQDKSSLIRVEYNLKYLSDTGSNLYHQEPAELFIDDDQSYFVSTQKSTSDSIAYLNLPKERHIRGRTKPLRVQKDFGKGNTFYYESFYPDVFLKTEETMSDMAWEIQSDTATLFGYLCQKATLKYRGRDWTAWFALDIPISDGPYKFGGLPGLIVRMNDSRNHWFIDFQSLTHLPGRKLDISFLNTATKLSAAELRDQLIDFKENSFERLEAAGILGVRAEDRAQIIKSFRENQKKNNNEIELKIN